MTSNTRSRLGRTVASDPLFNLGGLRGSDRLRSKPTQPQYSEDNNYLDEDTSLRRSKRSRTKEESNDQKSQSDNNAQRDTNNCDRNSLRASKPLIKERTKIHSLDSVHCTQSSSSLRKSARLCSQPASEDEANVNENGATSDHEKIEVGEYEHDSSGDDDVDTVDDKATYPKDRVTRSRCGKSAEFRHKDESNESSENDEEEDEEQHNDENEEVLNKYMFRDRSKIRRETPYMGGMGINTRKSNRTSQISKYVDNQSRLYLGGKIPNYNLKSNQYNKRKNKLCTSNRKHFDSSSDSSSSSESKHDSYEHNKYNDINRNRNGGIRDDIKRSGDRDDDQFHNYESRRLQNERDSIQPINVSTTDSRNQGLAGSLRDHASKRDLLRADVTPVAVDPKLGFDSVGGLENHIKALKEMVLLPLLYPDVFSRFKTEPPRGVLFVGPPGTGRTVSA